MFSMRGIAARAKRDDREMIAWDHFYYHQYMILLESQILQYDIVDSSIFGANRTQAIVYLFYIHLDSQCEVSSQGRRKL